MKKAIAVAMTMATPMWVGYQLAAWVDSELGPFGVLAGAALMAWGLLILHVMTEGRAMPRAKKKDAVKPGDPYLRKSRTQRCSVCGRRPVYAATGMCAWHTKYPLAD